MPAGFGEIEPGLRVQFESKIEGLLSGDTQRKKQNTYFRKWKDPGEADKNLKAYHLTRWALLSEKRQLFPEDEKDFLPTRLGNGLRAAERYGSVRYGLDTQSLWYELGAATPDDLAEELNAARGVVDFFISAATLSLLYALIAVSAALAEQDWAFVVYALIALGVSRLSYLRAARSTGAIARAQQAIVNVSRGKLADLFGLAVPGDIQKERAMWRALKEFVAEGKGAEGECDALGEWRKPASLDQKGERRDDGAAAGARPATRLSGRRRAIGR